VLSCKTKKTSKLEIIVAISHHSHGIFVEKYN